MIRRLVVRDPRQAVVPWWGVVESLRNLDEICFDEGLNILWGRNGSGKSTVVRALAELTHSYQGGVSKVTRSSLRAFFPQGAPPRFGVVLEHDGQAARSFVAGKEYGVSGAGMDDDFFDLGLRTTLLRASSGQAQISWVSETLRHRDWPTVEWFIEEEKAATACKDQLRQTREVLFTPQIPPGPRTVLLDEPDRSLDMDNLEVFWKLLPRIAARGYQIIVATHSGFALDIPDARYIDLSPGYVETCRNLRKGTS